MADAVGGEGMLHECEHIKELRSRLLSEGFNIWGELTEKGWINVFCGKCNTTFEIQAIRESHNG